MIRNHRRFRELKMHEYRFLICDGEGARSRGGHPDNFYEEVIKAENSKDAVIQIFKDLMEHTWDEEIKYAYEEEGEEWAEELKEMTGEELLHNIEDDKDIGSGVPFLAGYMVDGKIKDFDLMPVFIENSYDPEADILNLLDNGVDVEKWGIDPTPYLSEDDDWVIESRKRSNMLSRI